MVFDCLGTGERPDTSRTLAGHGQPVHVSTDNWNFYRADLGKAMRGSGAVIPDLKNHLVCSHAGLLRLPDPVQNLYFSNSYVLFNRCLDVAGDNDTALNHIGDALGRLKAGMRKPHSCIAKSIKIIQKEPLLLLTMAFFSQQRR